MKNSSQTASVLGHPAQLFVLFFTEMWERFSYYGMRGLFVIFLTSTLLEGGWAWTEDSAMALYGTYTSLVYLSPILGGFVADKFIGNRNAAIFGALLMTFGHASLAIESPTFLYIGLVFLILGNGFFKPNMTSIVSKMYEKFPEKKDGAFTIFYMGVNAGAFFGIMLCGYIGEQVSWSYGFGLAGIFMLFGLIQFHFARKMFGDIGAKPVKSITTTVENNDTEKLNPFTRFDLTLIGMAAITATIWVINDPLSKVYHINLFGNSTNANYAILSAFCLFLTLLFIRIMRYDRVTKQRMIAVFLLAIFYMVFWACFEQAGGSMTIFAKDYTDRMLYGTAGLAFKVVNSLLTVIPLGIITYVLIKLFSKTFRQYSASNIALGTSFVIIWGIVIWYLNREFGKSETEIPASWFGILNSFFIIALGPLFSKLWEKNKTMSVSIKYGYGLTFLGIGFLFLCIGTQGVPADGTVKASIMWLIAAYLFHTIGELCISPVGLSYVSKLVPNRMIGMMFGIWYIAVAIGNKLAGTMGGQIEAIAKEEGLSYFFLLFAIFPAIMAIIMILLKPVFRKLMHGIHGLTVN